MPSINKSSKLERTKAKREDRKTRRTERKEKRSLKNRGFEGEVTNGTIVGGLFKTDEYKTFMGKFLQLFSRFTWELPQTVIGFGTAVVISTFNNVDVFYHRGSTLLVTEDSFLAVGIGSYFMVGGSALSSTISYGNKKVSYLKHEFGHNKQSSRWGLFWIPYIIPGFVRAGLERIPFVYNHKKWNYNNFYTEKSATRLGDLLF